MLPLPEVLADMTLSFRIPPLPKVSCDDNPDFRDALGNPCSYWGFYNCVDYGNYSAPERQEILYNCRATCGACTAGAPGEVSLSSLFARPCPSCALIPPDIASY